MPERAAAQHGPQAARLRRWRGGAGPLLVEVVEVEEHLAEVAAVTGEPLGQVFRRHVRRIAALHHDPLPVAHPAVAGRTVDVETLPPALQQTLPHLRGDAPQALVCVNAIADP